MPRRFDSILSAWHGVIYAQNLPQGGGDGRGEEGLVGQLVGGLVNQ